MHNFYSHIFAAKARNWCRTLPVASIHTWEQFMTIFLCKFDGNIYEQVCDDFEDLRRFEGEYLIDFTIRFRLNCLKFKTEDKPLKKELLYWFEHIFSLPSIQNPCEIISNFDQFPPNFIDQFQKNISSSIEEDTTLKSENQYALESENQIINWQILIAIKISDNMQSAVKKF